MWEDTSKRKRIINIILVVLILIVVAGIGFFVLQLREQTEAHDKELSKVYAQQQQQQAEARQESMTVVDAEYARDLQAVAEYLPGIVCWGDNTTAAVSGLLNYPYVLQTYIDTYLCDIYDLSSSIENAADYSRLDWKKYNINIPVVNMAAGRESTYTVMGRAGVDPYVVSKEFTIPAEAEPVEISFTSSEGKAVTPLTGGDAGVNNVFISGVEGKLSLNQESSSYNGAYYFTRLTPGAEIIVEPGTAIKTASEGLYKNYIHVIFVGMYGDYANADDLVRQVKTLLARQTQNSERFIVLGPYSHNIYTSSSSAIEAVDNAMLAAFGSRYISIRKYLIGDGYIDAGKTPTNDDNYYIKQEIVPPTFKVSSNSEELNSLAHRLIGKLIYTRMDNLGYFDELKEELNLTETTKKILKEDPQYFESIIKNILK